MPHCTKCGSIKAQLNVGSLCKTCFAESKRDNNTNGLNEYHNSNFDHSCTVGNEHILSQVNYRETSSNNTQVPIITSPVLDVNKPISAINIGELLQIINALVTKPLELKIDELEKCVTRKVASIEKRVNLMENELDREMKKTENLTGIIINMQKALNRVDSDGRVNNVMVFGFQEDNVTTDVGVLDSDEKKFQYIKNRNHRRITRPC